MLLLLMVGFVPLALPSTSTRERVDPGAPVASVAQTGGEALPSIIVLVLDTVRADRLSLYGYERDTTPNLRGFVEDHERAVVFPLVISPASWTLPAHASLFTGELPSSHGAHAGRLLDLRHTVSPDDGLIAEATLAEVVRDRGYRTAAILANAQITFFKNMDRGFDQVVVPRSPGKLSLFGEALRARFTPGAFAHLIKAYPPAASVNREILRYLESCGDPPCFLLGNYMEAHWPYAARPPHGGKFSGHEWRWRTGGTDRYDEEILALDESLGELLAEFDQRGILDRSWLVITSDHGEAFGEHDTEFHGTSVFNEQVWIPLLIHPPLGESITPHDSAVSLIDLTATLSAIAGAEPLGRGRDLRKEIELAPVQVELYGDVRLTMAERTRWRAVVLGQAKLIDRSGVTELYQLAEDTAERNDQAPTTPEVVSDLVPLLPPLTESPAAVGTTGREATVEELERLRALGYVE
jgi:arylsulfatase A-like enzyme